MSPRYYRATKVRFLRACYYSVLAVFLPNRLEEETKKDSTELNKLLEGAEPEPSPFVIRRAFWYSLLVMVSSTCLGYAAGVASARYLGCAASAVRDLLTALGAGILLWGTLFVRGWQIQTTKGLTLPERVNQWIYRALYFIGTALVVWSISWPLCT